MKHKSLVIIGLLLFTLASFGQGMKSYKDVLTYEYAVKDTSHLMLDVYVPNVQNELHSCMIYCNGHAFIDGSRKEKAKRFLRDYYTRKGWVFISIDYRQGLKDCPNFTLQSGSEKGYQAIVMAGEDLLSATNYVVRNLTETPQFSINPAYIVTAGGSAGAITVLEADYFLANRIHGGELLPDTFRYAGVMAFAGAVVTDLSKVEYRVHAPAPTLFCQGVEDHFVEYGRITYRNLSMNGSKELAERFKKFGYPYYLRSYEGLGHEAAGAYRIEYRLMDFFLEEFVFNRKFLQINELYNDPSLPHIEGFNLNSFEEHVERRFKSE